MTGLVDRLERELYAARTVRPTDSARYAAVLERAVRMCGADSEAAEAFDLADLYLELATEYQFLGRWEDALAAADAAVDAGLDMQPDPRCLRAEILMRAGRAAEAEPIWAAVRADTPDDVWLYNNAGLEYAELAIEAVLAGKASTTQSFDRACSWLPADGAPSAKPQPATIVRSSSGSSATPASASTIAAGGALRSTRSSRVNTRVPRPSSATRTKTGLPNGGIPSSRARPGSANPASIRPRSLVDPTFPASPIDAVMVLTPRQFAVACS